MPDIYNTKPSRLSIWWLGQAGFLIRTPETAIVIDPYLSDSLAIKYRDKKFKHIRMMPAPVEPADLTGIDWVLSTHRHTDHMDAATLLPLFEANPGCRYVAPKAAAVHAFDVCGLPREITTLVDAGDHTDLGSGVELDVIASAHEELATDDDGHCVFLGFILHTPGGTIFHSGDCVPYEGQAGIVKQFNVDLALLPVNGRDEVRALNGVPGNFHFEEAVELCHAAGIPQLVPHHFGLFDFNTADPDVLRAKIANLEPGLNAQLPEVGQCIVIG